MNLAHIHIMLNHVPSLGTLLAVAMLIWAFVKKSEEVKKLSLEAFVLVALATIPTYLSGNAAHGYLRANKRPDIPQALIEIHQNSAMVTLILMIFTGTLAWFGLWTIRRRGRAGTGTMGALLVFSLLTAGFILRTASMGGEISHPEIRSSLPIPQEAGWREYVSKFANGPSWAWPTSETVHFVGMALLFGVVFVVNLRMLGLMKSIPFSALHRLLPLGIVGFLLNVISGFVFFMASPGIYIGNWGFAAKIICLMLAGINVIYFTVFDEPWKIGADQAASARTKFIAVWMTAMILGVMFFGRMLPFLRQ